MRARYALLAVLGAALGAFLVVPDLVGRNEAPVGDAEPTRSSTEPAPPAVLFADGATLRRAPLDPGSPVTVTELPGPDVVAASSEWLAVTVAGRPSADGDFPAAPRLRLLTAAPVRRERGANRTSVSLGPGLAPSWRPGAEELAYLRPVAGLRCEAERCEGDVEVVLAGPARPRARTLLAPGRWGLLGWSGDELLVADGRDLDHTLAVSTTGRSRDLDVAPSELWGASPDGRWLITVSGRSTRLAPTERPGSGGRLELDGARLGEGAWAPDSSAAAAIVFGGGSPTRLALLMPGRSRPVPVAGSTGAIGQIVWGAASDSVAFARSGNSGRLEATFCELSPEVRCRALFSWRQGVRLLRLE